MTTITLGPWTFDHVSYDAEADVVYLSIGEPRRALGEETPEGHVALFEEETGEFCGLTLIGLRSIPGPERAVTLPSPPTSGRVAATTPELDELVCA